MSSHRLVVARYRESVDWAEAFGTYTIYNKGRDDLPARIRSNSVRLPNVGREAHTYIHHIVENYDSLEDVMIFSQGGYRAHVRMEPDEFFRAAVEVGDEGFGIKLFSNLLVAAAGSNSRDFTLRWHGAELKTKDPYDLGGWWEKTTGEAWVRSRSVFWGATFSVKRECILRRSRENYVEILKTLDWCANPMESHFCERAWFNILNLPLNFFMGANESCLVPALSEDKEECFGVERLLEKWNARIQKNDRRKITVRVRKPLMEDKGESLLTKSELVGFLDHTKDLMKEDESTVRRVTEALRQNIEEWTTANCPAYPIDKPYVDKLDLSSKDGWYVNKLSHESMEVGTTGSTTGSSFRYMRWHPAFHKIEWDYHYNFVLDEFNVKEDYKIMYFFSDHFKADGADPIACFGGKSELPMNNHGTSRSPVTHYVNFPIYQKDQESFFRYFFEYMRVQEIDVLFTSPPQISSMCNYIRKFGVRHKIASLLSSTGDRILPADARFLFVDNKYFDDICDHMRCWDGGATFYTCKHRNYHLMDNLAWVEEIDGKMICTDYFNLASPFVRYWNGDYCRISNEYQRCECGRLYREFEFMESRPFSLKGVCMKDIKDGLKTLKIPGIKEVRCSQSHLDVVSAVPIPQEDRVRIAALSDKFPFRFITEEFHS